MTQVVRIKINADKLAFNTTIENECNVRLAAGFRLSTAFAMGDDLVLIFQQ
jgi:hypothetical protein